CAAARRPAGGPSPGPPPPPPPPARYGRAEVFNWEGALAPVRRPRYTHNGQESVLAGAIADGGG
ncbi:MAG: hypothetical protein AMXMBFR13_19220, partial [Phycisphaerae bacterium]